MHVLIVKTSSMGDILHTLPALTDAMRLIPDIRFDWVIEENFIQIPYWHPAVENVIPIAIRRWRKNWFGKEQRQERMFFKTNIRAVKYDVIIDAQGLIKSAFFVTRLAKGDKHGEDIYSACESLSNLWYDKHHQINKKQHAVERIRELFSKSLGYKKPETRGDYAFDSSSFSLLPSDAYQYLILLHATTSQDKQWPEEYWRKLISYLPQNILRIKIPWGTESEYQRSQRIAKGFNQVEVLPRLSLKQIARQLAGTRAVVSVDTGLNHLTAALNRPNITLYGPTDPKLVGGYGENQIALISPTNKLIDIKVKYVLQYLEKIIGDVHI